MCAAARSADSGVGGGDSLGSGMEAPVSIVTGAGSGIGRATAAALSWLGHRVVLAGRRLAALQETAAGLTTETLCVPTDVGEAGECRSLIAAALDCFGRVDALVNNAGYAPSAPIGSHDDEMIRRVFATNAMGPATLISAVWPTMVRQGGGRIVNVSSMATVDPFPGLFAYAASKGAVEVMVKSCEVEGRARGIRAFGVAPGAVETAMLRGIVSEADLPSSRCLRPEDVARVIADCAAGRRDGDSGKVILLPSG